MQHFIKAFVIISAAVCCLACGRHTDRPDNDSSFAIDTITVLEDNDTPVDSIIQSIEYVKLQSFENTLIGWVSKIIVTEDHIVVADTRMAKAVFIFDRKGNAQAIISRLGRGPQEYTTLSDIAVTPDQKQIAMLDNGSGKVIYYDMAGKFIKKQEIPLWAIHVEFIDDRTMLYTTNGTSKRDDIPAEMSLHYVDTDMNVLESTFPTRQNSAQGFTMTPVIKRNGNRLHVLPAYGDTIYKVTSERRIPNYWIDMSRVSGKTSRDFDYPMTNEKFRLMMQDASFFNGLFAESDNFGLFRVFYPKRGKLILYSKQKKKSYNLNMDLLSDVFYMYLNSNEIFTYKDQFVIAVPAYHFEGNWPENELYNKIKQGITENDNPVLLFYTFKDADAPAAD